MKIKDILNRLDVIAEAPAQPAKQPPLVIPKSLTNKIANDPNNKTLAQQNPPIGGQATQTAPNTAYKGSAGAQAIAKASGVADVNKIKAGQQLTLPDGTKYTVKPGDTLDKIAAANKGGAAAPPATGAPSPSAENEKAKQGIAAGIPAAADATAAAPAAAEEPIDASQKDAVDASNAVNAAAVAKMKALQADGEQSAQPEAPAASGNTMNAASLRSKINAGGTETGTTAGTDTTQPQSQDEVDRISQLAGQRPGGIAFNQDAQGTSAGQAAQEQPPAPAANPSAGAAPVKSSDGSPVKTGDGSTLKTRSDNEIWWSQQPGNRGKQYPGDAVAQQQYDARQASGKQNMDALKGVGNKIAGFFGGNKQPAAPAAPAPAAEAPYNRLKDPNSITRSITPNTGSAAVNAFESEMSLIKHLSGIK